MRACSGLPFGTFDIGDIVYETALNTHRFKVRVDCDCCNDGTILIAGKMFECPNCKGHTHIEDIIEVVVNENENIIRSKNVFENETQKLEAYCTGIDYIGTHIYKSDIEWHRFFKSIEEAQQFCEEYNKRNKVYEKINFNKEKMVDYYIHTYKHESIDIQRENKSDIL